MEYAVIACALLLVAGSAAAALAVMWRKFERAIGEAERAAAARLDKLESAVAEKADESEFRNVTLMLDGVTSSSRRLERRISRLENDGRDIGSDSPEE